MSGDIFLEIDDAKGESEKDGHKEQIEIYSVSWGASNPTSFALGGGGGVGKVSVSSISFTKAMDKASPKLYNFCCNGKHLPKAIIHFRKAGEKPQEYLKITLTEVMIESFSLSDSSGAELPHESFSIAFAKIEGEYSPQDKEGKLGSAIPFGWNVKEHKPAP